MGWLSRNRLKGSIFETAAILKDWWMQCVGGMMVAWDIWEMSIIPSLLAHSGSWVEIIQRATDTLDGLQNWYCSLVHACPCSTPKPAIRGQAGLLDMTYQIWIEKVCLLTSIMCSREEQSYAKEVLEVQLNMGWVGLTSEAEEICLKLGLPNTTRQYVHTEHELDPARLSNFKELTVVLLEDRR